MLILRRYEVSPGKTDRQVCIHALKPYVHSDCGPVACFFGHSVSPRQGQHGRENNWPGLASPHLSAALGLDMSVVKVHVSVSSVCSQFLRRARAKEHFVSLMVVDGGLLVPGLLPPPSGLNCLASGQGAALAKGIAIPARQFGA